MTIDRRPAIVIVIALSVLAFMGILLTLAWMSPLKVPPTPCEDLSVTDVQFDRGRLTLTIKNLCGYPTKVRAVMVNQTSTQHTFPVDEPIAAGKQISIRINFNWTSGYTYRVGLITARSNSFFKVAAAP